MITTKIKWKSLKCSFLKDFPLPLNKEITTYNKTMTKHKKGNKLSKVKRANSIYIGPNTFSFRQEAGSASGLETNY